jgi:hypothetical protein
VKAVILMLVLCAAEGSIAAKAQNAVPSQCPSPELIDCTPTRNCEKTEDNRDCNRCLFSVFGGCRIRSNDPVCEAAKAAQNSAYAAAKSQCEAERTIEKAQCEAAKAAVKNVAAACEQK